jgi:glycosyltransferase involved in cell wall biosynthesis
MTAKSSKPVVRPLRVLTLTDKLVGGGGAERLAAHIAVGLDRARFESHLCGTRRTVGPLVDDVKRSGVDYFDLDRTSRYQARAWWPLLVFLRRKRIDVLHAHKFTSNVWGTLFGRLTGVPVVIAHEHTWSYEGQRLRRLLDREVIGRGADAFVAVSREDQRKMIEVEGVDPRVTRFVPNGIPPLPAPEDRNIRAELGIPPDAFLAGSVGVLRAQKAFDVLVDAAAIAAVDVPQLRVVVAGTGPERDALERRIEERGMRSVVRLLGHRRDVPTLLSAFDVAVLSSDFEGSPLAVMEYMAAGKPIVATSVGGVPDLITHGEHGLLVPKRDPKALAAAIVRLARSPDLRATLGAAARERQAREFDISVTVRAIEDLYEELFLRTRRARRERWSARTRVT